MARTAKPLHDQVKDGIMTGGGLPRLLYEAVDELFELHDGRLALGGISNTAYSITPDGDALRLARGPGQPMPQWSWMKQRPNPNPAYEIIHTPPSAGDSTTPTNAHLGMRGRQASFMVATLLDSSPNGILHTGKETIHLGSQLLKSLHASRRTTFENYTNTVQNRPCEYVGGNEEVGLWEDVSPIAASDPELWAYPDQSSGLVAKRWRTIEQYDPDDFPLYVFSFSRLITPGGKDKMCYQAVLEADHLVGPRTWLTVTGDHFFECPGSKVSYARLGHGEDASASQPIALDPATRFKVHGAIGGQLSPDNLMPVHNI